MPLSLPFALWSHAQRVGTGTKGQKQRTKARVGWFKLISKFKAFWVIIFIWRFHNLLYTLIAFLSVFVFGVDLKDFLSTIGLIYLSFYNLVKEFKLNIYSVFYNWFNPSSFDNLIKDIRSYVDNSNNRIKAFTTVAIVTTTVPTLWAWDQRVAAVEARVTMEAIITTFACPCPLGCGPKGVNFCPWLVKSKGSKGDNGGRSLFLGACF